MADRESIPKCGIPYCGMCYPVGREEKDFNLDIFNETFRIATIKEINVTLARIKAKEEYPDWGIFRTKLIGKNQYKFLLFKRNKRGRRWE